MGTINVEQAIFASNEGQRDFNELSKKLEPKQTELKGKNDEIEGIKKQLNTQGDKMNEEAKANLTKQIDSKQKQLERNAQDAQEDARNQENEIAQRILQKMAPVIVKFATDNGYGMIVQTSPSMNDENSGTTAALRRVPGEKPGQQCVAVTIWNNLRFDHQAASALIVAL